jgi:hypothetical protein
MLQSTPQGNEEIADWIELSLLCSDSKILRFSDLERKSELYGVGDIQIRMASNLIARRSEVLRVNYPFVADGRSIRIENDALASGYTFCVLNSLSQNLITWDSNFNFGQGAEEFEQFSLSAIRSWLGADSDGVNFGWPSKHGRPMEFNHAIDWLAERIGVKAGSGFRPPRRKDGGVDLVVWRAFHDNKSGFPIYLAQCTLQQDYLAKGRDIDLRLWSGWLALERDPETILAIPRTVPVGTLWGELTANNLVLERLRLVNAFGARPLESNLVDFNVKRIKRLQVGMRG